MENKILEKAIAMKSGKCCCESYIGKEVNNFKLKSYLPHGKFGEVELKKNMDSKKWTFIYFYPADFTFVCPTEIKEISSKHEEFKKLKTEVIGVSTDKVYSHKAWVERDFNGKINHPLAEDPTGKLAKYFRIYDSENGLALRGSFIISPDGILWSQYINNAQVGRNINEVLRNIQGCQEAYAGKLVPCNWTPGEE